MKQYCHIPTPLGTLTAVSEGGYLTELHLREQELPGVEKGTNAVLAATSVWLACYFRGEAPSINIPMKPTGTAFQTAVWAQLQQIPYGQTVTYGALAKGLGAGRMSAQAVGQAVGRNPIPILIPCHRVLGAGGKLTGYAGGLERKRALLDLEQIKYR